MNGRCLHICFAFGLLAIISCDNHRSIEKKYVFESALESDSLSYYFPSILNDTIARKNSKNRDFSQRWYSSTLFSFKEPILYNSSASTTMYRILWLRSFHVPVCFSLKEMNGSYFLNTKVLDKQPSFYPEYMHSGKFDNAGNEGIDTIEKGDRFALIVYYSIKEITSSQWNEIEKHLNRLNFWKGPIIDPYDQLSRDCANWIIEGRKNKVYHFIDRRNEFGELKPLGKYLVNLSGIEIDHKLIY